MAMLDLEQTSPADRTVAASLVDREIGDLVRAHPHVEQGAILLEGRRPADAAGLADIEIVAPSVIERQQITTQWSQRNQVPYQRFDRERMFAFLVCLHAGSFQCAGRPPHPVLTNRPLPVLG